MSEKWPKKAVIFAAFCLILGTHWCAPSAASAQRLSTELSARQVEVGETFVVQLTTLVDSDSAKPENPELKLPPGIVATPPSVSSQQQVSIVNGHMSRSYGVTASWSVTPTKAGQYTIGPASIVIQGRRLSDDPQRIAVVPRGSSPQRQPNAARRSPFGFDPWDPFGSGPLSNRLRGLQVPAPNLDEQTFEPPQVPEEWRVETAPDPLAFLIAKVSPRKVVVGQGLTLKLFAYSSYPAFDDVSATDVTRKEFLAFDLTNKDNVHMQRVPIGNEVFSAGQIRELLLIPLSPGRFQIGEMTMQLALLSRRGQQVVERKSSPVEVEVVEPPLQGRPAGYRLGDVGHFELRVEVSPREVEVGGSVAVTAWLEGQGNFPPSLRLPERNGVEFSEPTVNEEIEPKEGALAGYRKFSYVVRLTEAGEFDLTKLLHPYYNPSAGYETASAELGRVRVRAVSALLPPGAEPAPPEAAVLEPLQRISQLMKARPVSMNALSAKRTPSDHPWFFPLLLLGPALVVVGQGLGKVARALLLRARQRRDSARSLAEAALVEASESAQAGSLDSVAALERALFIVLEQLTGLKGRGVLRANLKQELVARSLPEELAAAAVQLLDQCEAMRFAGGAEKQLSTLLRDTQAWVARAQKVRVRGTK